MIANGRPVKVFSGKTSRPLSEKICRELEISLSNNSLSTFADGEICVWMDQTVRGQDCFVVQSTCKPVNDNLMALLINIDALRRASAGRITAVIPYFGYARQDRKAKGRDPITAKLVANMITAAGADRVLTMDLHAAQIQGFFDIPLDHLSGAPLFVDYYMKKFDPAVCNHDEFVAVSPDVGSVARTRNFAQQVHMDLAIVDKRRPKDNVCEVMNVIGDVKGKTCIMLDDIVDTAGSLCNAAKALVEVGGAKEVYACATHGVLSNRVNKETGEVTRAWERIENSVIKELLLLDTIPLPEDYAGTKIKQLSVAPVFAKAIRHIYEETSISDCIFGAR
ncbi:MAG: ribose-phosphate pyrophosphokinase [Oscillospiraceae bacterium]|nr:ribose-phosphate pyrophosphokinase [Oscillospiraceae bacterium]